MIADTKRCQTYINELAKQAIVIRTAVAVAKTMRDKFMRAVPITTGTCLEGNETKISTALDMLDIAVNSPLWVRLIAASVPSHEGKAL